MLSWGNVTGEHRSDCDMVFWSSMAGKKAFENWFSVSGLVKLRACVGRKAVRRRLGLGAGAGEVLTRFGGESMAWSWERILGSKMGPC